MADSSLIRAAHVVNGARVTVHSGGLAWSAHGGVTRIPGHHPQHEGGDS
jgi:hypothetical protein